VWWIIFVLLIGVVLTVLFWAGTLTLQGWWYSEPVPGIAWRAAAGGGAIMAFIAFWCFLNYRLIDPAREEVPYGALTQFAFTEYDPPQGFEFFESVKNGKTSIYVKQPPPRDDQGRQTSGAVYVEQSTRKPWRPGDAEGLVEEVRIPYPDPNKPDDPRAYVTRNYKLVKPASGRPEPGQTFIFKADSGDTITENDVTSGKVARFRWGLLIGYVLLNVVNLALAFVVLWLLLRYQWGHALGLAVVLWLVLSIGVFPPLFSMVRAAGPQQPPAAKKLIPPAPKTGRHGWPGGRLDAARLA
jgi:hypothetical protein